MFSVRLVSADSYQAHPLPQLDPAFSEFRGSEIKHVPVIRVFGSTSTGEKTCLHIHGVFPYIYVPYTGEEDPTSLAYRLAAALDAAINVSLGSATSNTQHVYLIQRVSGVPFYGYHKREHQYLKIHFYNPAMIKRAADLLQNGSVLNQCLQPHEAHIPYILQFMMDYNVYGMSMINMSGVKHRRLAQSLAELASSGQGATSESSEIEYLPNSVERQSTCELEIDALASDILNRREIERGLDLNPGLAAIWDEERARRAQAGLQGGDSQLVNPKSPPRPTFQPTDNDVYQEQRLARRLLMISQCDESTLSTTVNRSVAYAAEVREGEDLSNSSNISVPTVQKSQLVPREDTIENTSFLASPAVVGSQKPSGDCSVLGMDDMPLVDLLVELAGGGNSENSESVDTDSVLGSQVSLLLNDPRSDNEDEDIPDLNLTCLQLDSLSDLVNVQNPVEQRNDCENSLQDKSSSSTVHLSPFLTPCEAASSSSRSGDEENAKRKTRETRKHRVPQYDGAGDVSPTLVNSSSSDEDDDKNVKEFSHLPKHNGTCEVASLSRKSDGREQTTKFSCRSSNGFAINNPWDSPLACEWDKGNERSRPPYDRCSIEATTETDASTVSTPLPSVLTNDPYFGQYSAINYEPFDRLLEIGPDFVPDLEGMHSSMEIGILLSSGDSDSPESVGQDAENDGIPLDAVLNGDPCFTESAELDKSDVTELRDQYASLLGNSLLPDVHTNPRIDDDLGSASNFSDSDYQGNEKTCRFPIDAQSPRSTAASRDSSSSSENVTPNIQEPEVKSGAKSKLNANNAPEDCKELPRVPSDNSDHNCNFVATWAELQNIREDKRLYRLRNRKTGQWIPGPRQSRRKADRRSLPNITSQLFGRVPEDMQFQLAAENCHRNSRNVHLKSAGKSPVKKTKNATPSAPFVAAECTIAAAKKTANLLVVELVEEKLSTSPLPNVPRVPEVAREEDNGETGCQPLHTEASLAAFHRSIIGSDNPLAETKEIPEKPYSPEPFSETESLVEPAVPVFEELADNGMEIDEPGVPEFDIFQGTSYYSSQKSEQDYSAGGAEHRHCTWSASQRKIIQDQVFTSDQIYVIEKRKRGKQHPPDRIVCTKIYCKLPIVPLNKYDRKPDEKIAEIVEAPTNTEESSSNNLPRQPSVDFAATLRAEESRSLQISTADADVKLIEPTNVPDRLPKWKPRGRRKRADAPMPSADSSSNDNSSIASTIRSSSSSDDGEPGSFESNDSAKKEGRWSVRRISSDNEIRDPYNMRATKNLLSATRTERSRFQANDRKTAAGTSTKCEDLPGIPGIMEYPKKRGRQRKMVLSLCNGNGDERPEVESSKPKKPLCSVLFPNWGAERDVSESPPNGTAKTIPNGLVVDNRITSVSSDRRKGRSLKNGCLSVSPLPKRSHSPRDTGTDLSPSSIKLSSTPTKMIDKRIYPTPPTLKQVPENEALNSMIREVKCPSTRAKLKLLMKSRRRSRANSCRVEARATERELRSVSEEIPSESKAVPQMSPKNCFDLSTSATPTVTRITASALTSASCDMVEHPSDDGELVVGQGRDEKEIEAACECDRASFEKVADIGDPSPNKNCHSPDGNPVDDSANEFVINEASRSDNREAVVVSVDASTNEFDVDEARSRSENSEPVVDPVDASTGDFDGPALSAVFDSAVDETSRDIFDAESENPESVGGEMDNSEESNDPKQHSCRSDRYAVNEANFFTASNYTIDAVSLEIPTCLFEEDSNSVEQRLTRKAIDTGSRNLGGSCSTVDDTASSVNTDPGDLDVYDVESLTPSSSFSQLADVDVTESSPNTSELSESTVVDTSVNSLSLTENSYSCSGKTCEGQGRPTVMEYKETDDLFSEEDSPEFEALSPSPKVCELLRNSLEEQFDVNRKVEITESAEKFDDDRPGAAECPRDVSQTEKRIGGEGDNTRLDEEFKDLVSQVVARFDNEEDLTAASEGKVQRVSTVEIKDQLRNDAEIGEEIVAGTEMEAEVHMDVSKEREITLGEERETEELTTFENDQEVLASSESEAEVHMDLSKDKEMPSKERERKELTKIGTVQETLASIHSEAEVHVDLSKEKETSNYERERKELTKIGTVQEALASIHSEAEVRMDLSKEKETSNYERERKELTKIETDQEASANRQSEAKVRKDLSKEKEMPSDERQREEPAITENVEKILSRTASKIEPPSIGEKNKELGAVEDEKERSIAAEEYVEQQTITTRETILPIIDRKDEEFHATTVGEKDLPTETDVKPQSIATIETTRSIIVEKDEDATTRIEKQLPTASKKDVDPLSITTRETEMPIIAEKDEVVEAATESENKLPTEAEEDVQPQLITTKEIEQPIIAEKDEVVEAVIESENKLSTEAEKNVQSQLITTKEIAQPIIAEKDKVVEAVIESENKLSTEAEETVQSQLITTKEIAQPIIAEKDKVVEAVIESENKLSIDADKNVQPQLITTKEIAQPIIAEKDEVVEAVIESENKLSIDADKNVQSQLITTKEIVQPIIAEKDEVVEAAIVSENKLSTDAEEDVQPQLITTKEIAQPIIAEKDEVVEAVIESENKLSTDAEEDVQPQLITTKEIAQPIIAEKDEVVEAVIESENKLSTDAEENVQSQLITTKEIAQPIIAEKDEVVEAVIESENKLSIDAEKNVQPQLITTKEIVQPIIAEQDEVVEAANESENKLSIDAEKNVQSQLITTKEIVQPIIAEKDEVVKAAIESENKLSIDAEKNVQSQLITTKEIAQPIIAEKDEVVEAVIESENKLSTDAEKNVQSQLITTKEIAQPIIAEKDEVVEAANESENKLSIDAEKNVQPQLTTTKEIVQPISSEDYVKPQSITIGEAIQPKTARTDEESVTTVASEQEVSAAAETQGASEEVLVNAIIEIVAKRDFPESQSTVEQPEIRESESIEKTSEPNDASENESSATSRSNEPDRVVKIVQVDRNMNDAGVTDAETRQREAKLLNISKETPNAIATEGCVSEDRREPYKCRPVTIKLVSLDLSRISSFQLKCQSKHRVGQAESPRASVRNNGCATTAPLREERESTQSRASNDLEEPSEEATPSAQDSTRKIVRPYRARKPPERSQPTRKCVEKMKLEPKLSERNTPQESNSTPSAEATRRVSGEKIAPLLTPSMQDACCEDASQENTFQGRELSSQEIVDKDGEAKASVDAERKTSSEGGGCEKTEQHFPEFKTVTEEISQNGGENCRPEAEETLQGDHSGKTPEINVEESCPESKSSRDDNGRGATDETSPALELFSRKTVEENPQFCARCTKLKKGHNGRCSNRKLRSRRNHFTRSAAKRTARKIAETSLERTLTKREDSIDKSCDEDTVTTLRQLFSSQTVGEENETMTNFKMNGDTIKKLPENNERENANTAYTKYDSSPLEIEEKNTGPITLKSEHVEISDPVLLSPRSVEENVESKTTRSRTKKISEAGAQKLLSKESVEVTTENTSQGAELSSRQVVKEEIESKNTGSVRTGKDKVEENDEGIAENTSQETELSSQRVVKENVEEPKITRRVPSGKNTTEETNESVAENVSQESEPSSQQSVHDNVELKISGKPKRRGRFGRSPKANRQKPREEHLSSQEERRRGIAENTSQGPELSLQKIIDDNIEPKFFVRTKRKGSPRKIPLANGRNPSPEHPSSREGSSEDITKDIFRGSKLLSQQSVGETIKPKIHIKTEIRGRPRKIPLANSRNPSPEHPSSREESSEDITRDIFRGSKLLSQQSVGETIKQKIHIKTEIRGRPRKIPLANSRNPSPEHPSSREGSSEDITTDISRGSEFGSPRKTSEKRKKRGFPRKSPVAYSRNLSLTYASSQDESVAEEFEPKSLVKLKRVGRDQKNPVANGPDPSPGYPSSQEESMDEEIEPKSPVKVKRKGRPRRNQVANVENPSPKYPSSQEEESTKETIESKNPPKLRKRGRSRTRPLVDARKPSLETRSSQKDRRSDIKESTSQKLKLLSREIVVEDTEPKTSDKPKRRGRKKRPVASAQEPFPEAQLSQDESDRDITENTSQELEISSQKSNDDDIEPKSPKKLKRRGRRRSSAAADRKTSSLEIPSSQEESDRDITENTSQELEVSSQKSIDEDIGPKCSIKLERKYRRRKNATSAIGMSSLEIPSSQEESDRDITENTSQELEVSSQKCIDEDIGPKCSIKLERKDRRRKSAASDIGMSSLEIPLSRDERNRDITEKDSHELEVSPQKSIDEDSEPKSPVELRRRGRRRKSAVTDSKTPSLEIPLLQEENDREIPEKNSSQEPNLSPPGFSSQKIMAENTEPKTTVKSKRKSRPRKVQVASARGSSPNNRSSQEEIRQKITVKNPPEPVVTLDKITIVNVRTKISATPNKRVYHFSKNNASRQTRSAESQSSQEIVENVSQEPELSAQKLIDENMEPKNPARLERKDRPRKIPAANFQEPYPDASSSQVEIRREITLKKPPEPIVSLPKLARENIETKTLMASKKRIHVSKNLEVNSQKSSLSESATEESLPEVAKSTLKSTRPSRKTFVEKSSAEKASSGFEQLSLKNTKISIESKTPIKPKKRVRFDEESIFRCTASLRPAESLPEEAIEGPSPKKHHKLSLKPKRTDVPTKVKIFSGGDDERPNVVSDTEDASSSEPTSIDASNISTRIQERTKNKTNPSGVPVAERANGLAENKKLKLNFSDNVHLDLSSLQKPSRKPSESHFGEAPKTREIIYRDENLLLTNLKWTPPRHARLTEKMERPEELDPRLVNPRGRKWSRATVCVQLREPKVILKRLSRVSLKTYGFTFRSKNNTFVKNLKKSCTLDDFRLPAYDGAADFSSSDSEDDPDVTIAREEKRVCVYQSGKKAAGTRRDSIVTPKKRKHDEQDPEVAGPSSKRRTLATTTDTPKKSPYRSPVRTSMLKSPGRLSGYYSPLQIIVTSPKVRKDSPEPRETVSLETRDANVSSGGFVTPRRKYDRLHESMMRGRISAAKSSRSELGEKHELAAAMGSERSGELDGIMSSEQKERGTVDTIASTISSDCTDATRIRDATATPKDSKAVRKKLVFSARGKNESVEKSSDSADEPDKESKELNTSSERGADFPSINVNRESIELPETPTDSKSTMFLAEPGPSQSGSASDLNNRDPYDVTTDEDSENDDDACNVTFSQYVDSQINKNQTLLDRGEVNTELNDERVIVRPKFNPPDRRSVVETMETYGIPKHRNQEPFFSVDADVPKQKELAHKMLKVPGKGLQDVPAFVSSVEGVTGIARWRKMKIKEFNPSLARSKDIEVKIALGGNERVLLTPLVQPPTQKEVKDWLRAREYLSKKKKRDEEESNRKKVDDKAKIEIQAAVTEDNDERSSTGSDLSVAERSPEQIAGRNEQEKTLNRTLKMRLAKKGLLKKVVDLTASKLRDSSEEEIEIDAQKCMRSGEARKGSGDSNRTEMDSSLLSVLGKSRLFREQEASRHLGVSCGQIDFLSDSTRSNVGKENLRNAKALTRYQYLTIMCLEVHVTTRGDLLPDAQYDSIAAIFYSVQSDVPPTSSIKPLEHGVIVLAETDKAKNKMHYSYASNIPWSFSVASDEEALLNTLVNLITRVDPDILIGWELETLSWGYVFQRASRLGMNLYKRISRIPATQGKWEAQPRDIETLAEVKLPGRIVLDIWRLMRHEAALLSYTFESMMHHTLNERISCPSFKTLTDWWNLERSRPSRWRVVEHYSIRVLGVFRILDQLDIIGRTSELARLFGIQFFEVFSRGSQYRVESVMLRLAKPLKYIAVSPSAQQRASMRAMEALPLIMEPESMFYSDPLIVLDFQSLYPSIIIAHNYCFSTCLGRIEHIGQPEPFEFGAYTLRVPKSTSLKLQGKVNYAPCGVAFVKPEVCLGVLPRMLTEILETRFMVKKAMKDHKQDDKTLQRALHSRQMGLKFLANVTYGYTAANFSGRMPCIEVGDSVVSKSKETLERAIKLVESTPKWGARVVYGDTDSLFILVPGKSKADAFVIGNEIADAVTASNPPPIKLKFEKVMYPAILQTKKRYCGYMYETPEQEKPTYLAKGIETVRRDGCPAVSKILEKTLKILFETKDVSLVKKYVTRQLDKVLRGKVSIQDLTFAKEFRGLKGYKAKACVPALELTKRLMKKDPRAVPRNSERVRYVIVAGAPNQALIHCVRTPWELINDPGLRPNAIYYVTRVIIPPLNRCLNLMGVDVNAWYREMPHRHILDNPVGQPGDRQKLTIFQYFGTIVCAVCGQSSNKGICTECVANPPDALVVIHEKLRRLDRTNSHVTAICQSCVGQADMADCASLDCPVLYRRAQAQRELTQATHLRSIIECGNNLEL